LPDLDSSLIVEELEIYAQFYSAGIIAIYFDWLNNENYMPIERLGHIAGRILGEESGEHMFCGVHDKEAIKILKKEMKRDK
jgi:hypothetical protein